MNLAQPVPRPVRRELTVGGTLRCLPRRATAQGLALPLDLSTPDALKVIEPVPSYPSTHPERWRTSSLAWRRVGWGEMVPALFFAGCLTLGLRL